MRTALVLCLSGVALRDLPPPIDEVRAHLRGIADFSRRRQKALGIVPPHKKPAVPTAPTP